MIDDANELPLTHGSLFSGIGGFDLAAESLGWINVFNCEINPFCRRILKYYFPYSISHNDITKTDFSKYRGTIDVISGGFPCQPYSVAGLRKGSSDERDLWSEMYRAVKEIQPSFVVAENVYGLLNWGSGMVFHKIQSDLEIAGYELLPYLLPACGVDAPTLRERVFIIAYSERERSQALATGTTLFPPSTRETLFRGDSYRYDDPGSPPGSGRSIKELSSWKDYPTQSAFYCGDNGFSSRLDGASLSSHRVESLRAYGNAVVPQVARVIFKAIIEFNKHKNYDGGANKTGDKTSDGSFPG